MVRTIVTRDPEWDETERAWMLSLEAVRQREQAERCPACGGPKELCQSPDAEGQVAVDVARCHVSAAIQAKQRELEQNGFDKIESLAMTARVVSPDAE